MKRPSYSKRGRPLKFGRPSQIVALTLPDDIVRGLRKIDRDVAWAIVTLFEKTPRQPPASPRPQRDAELAGIADRRSLIVVNRTAFKRLPGISIIPLTGNRAFLALDVGRGMADLELAVLDRLEESSVTSKEHRALTAFKVQLRAWRRDHTFRFHTRGIIVVERVPKHARK